ncbi:MAG: FecR family protein [Runella sp.]
MTQQEFNILSKRYLEGQTTPEENQLLLQWYKNLPPHKDLPMPSSQKDEIRKRLWSKINSEIRQKQGAWKSNRMMWWIGTAASLLIVAIGWVFFASKTDEKVSTIPADEKHQEMGIELQNNTSTSQQIQLKDGSVVTLEPHSSLIYGRLFNESKREVILKGEAFFEIYHDATRPFVVKSGQLVAEVLGTSFHIKTDPRTKRIEIVVKSGKVSVYTAKNHQKIEKNGLILTRNQKVVFDQTAQNLIPGIVENPSLSLSPKVAKPQLVFEGASLQSVLHKLSDLYGIEFVITNPSIKHCRLTADLNGLSMFTQLELICKSVDATYEKRGTVIFLDGEGCP